MKYLFYIAIWLITHQCLAQDVHGTYIFAVPCQDAILIGADTRLTFSDSLGDIAYMDSLDKVITDNKIVVVSAGRYLFGKVTIRGFWEKIIPRLTSANILQIFSIFLDIVDKTGNFYEASDITDLVHENQFISAFYRGSNPVICLYGSGHNVCVENPQHGPHNRDFDIDDIGPNSKCVQALISIQSKIDSHIHRTGDRNISNTLTVYKVTKSYSTCIQNCEYYKPSSKEDLRQIILAPGFTYNLLPGGSDNRLFSMWRDK